MTYIQKISIAGHPVWKSLEWNDIPNVAVITGVNGSGKTKLLEALNLHFSGQQKTIYSNKRNINFTLTTQGISINSDEFNFIPWNRGGFGFETINAANLYQEKEAFVNQIRAGKTSFAQNDGQNYTLYTTLRKVLGKDLQNDETFLNSSEFNNAFSEGWIYSRDIINNQHISRAFNNYRIKFEECKNNNRNPETGYGKSDKEIIAEIGPAPWDLINALFKKYGFKYQVNFPKTAHETYSVYFQFENNSIDVGYLSSGEQMIVSLILWAYDDKISKFKKLLLLDEPDAHLHPQMAKLFKDVLYDILVKNFGMQVILTTHSPTTIAVFPDEAIYSASINDGIKKIKKEQAISLLTIGIPTLSVDYEGRRQAFVEDNNDAERYEYIYQALKPEINSDRSLNFIAVGKSGTSTTGCDAVKKIVTDLRNAGNKTISGLIDWDKKNSSSSGIFILGESKRYTFENFALDPILIAIALIKEQRKIKKEFGLADSEGLIDFPYFDASKIQLISNSIQEKILAKNKTKLLKVQYLDGIEIDIYEEYLYMDGHNLEKIIRDTYPAQLKKFHQDGWLTTYVCKEIIPEFKRFTPVEFKNVFSEMLGD